MGDQWGRLYYEWAHDLKVQTMTEADQRRHAMLLCMHIEGHTDPTDAEASFYMRVPLESWLDTKAAFLERGFLEGDSNHLANWERRQFKSDSSAERMRRHRDKNRPSPDRHRDVTSAVTVTPPETDTEEDTETEKKEETPLTPLAGGEPEKAPAKPKTDDGFEKFWQAYPPRRKQAKGAAERKFIQLRQSGRLPPIDELLDILSRQARSPDWTKQGGEYIPAPLTWLNQGRWLDHSALAHEKDLDDEIRPIGFKPQP